MNRADYIRFLESAVESQRTARRVHIGFAGGVVALGLIAVAAAQLFSGRLIPENVTWLVTLGGTFVSTLSSFPAKQIFDHRDKISALQFLLDGFAHLGDDKADLAGEEASRLTERFWKLMDTSLGR